MTARRTGSSQDGPAGSVAGPGAGFREPARRVSSAGLAWIMAFLTGQRFATGGRRQ